MEHLALIFETVVKIIFLFKNILKKFLKKLKLKSL